MHAQRQVRSVRAQGQPTGICLNRFDPRAQAARPDNLSKVLPSGALERDNTSLRTDGVGQRYRREGVGTRTYLDHSPARSNRCVLEQKPSLGHLGREPVVGKRRIGQGWESCHNPLEVAPHPAKR